MRYAKPCWKLDGLYSKYIHETFVSTGNQKKIKNQPANVKIGRQLNQLPISDSEAIRKLVPFGSFCY